AIGEIRMDVCICGMIGKLRQARLFQLDIVIIAEIVEADDRITALQQPLCDMGADEAGGAGNQNLHCLAHAPLKLVAPDQKRRPAPTGPYLPARLPAPSE